MQTYFYMGRCLLVGVILASFGGALAQGDVGADSSEATGTPADGFVVVCPVEGDILDGLAVLIERAVTVEARDAKAILFIVDTFGGRVDSAMEIAQTILDAPVPTIAYITGRGAISAGALISYACDHIVMAPGASIGASTPVMPGVEMSDQMNEKSMSFLRAKYRALGEAKGHNPLIGEAMVDASIELYGRRDADGVYTVYKVDQGRVIESYSDGGKKEVGAYSVGMPRLLLGPSAQPDLSEAFRGIQEALRDAFDLPTPPDNVPANEADPEGEAPEDDRVPRVRDLPDDARLISPAGKLVTLTTREAQEVGLVRYTADTPDKALHLLGFGEFTRIHIEMTWAEMIFAFLTSPLISGLLLLCGVGGLYVEFRTPGLGWPGLIGAICLALFFGSRMVIGIADWLDLLLVVVGLILLAVEIFVLPGFGIAGVSGIVCLLVGIYMSLIRVPIPEYTWDFMRLRDAGISLMMASLLLALFAILTWRIFPRSSLGRGLVLADAQSVSAGYVVQTATEMHTAVGLRGRATTMLRPAGRGRFGDTTYDLMTQGEFIESGCPIEIIQAEGNRYVVREITAEDQG